MKVLLLFLSLYINNYQDTNKVSYAKYEKLDIDFALIPTEKSYAESIVLNESDIKNLEFKPNSVEEEGFRIQIFSGKDIVNAMAIMQKFQKMYKKTKAYKVFSNGIYKIRVGNFKTKAAAESYKNQILYKFPKSFVVSDNIEDTNVIKDKNASIEVGFEDQNVLNMYIKKIQIDQDKEKLPGFRIQIFSGKSRENSDLIKLQFRKLYKKVEVYQIHKEPFYRIRVGDFYTKSDADEFCFKIKKHFPQAFVLPDDVEKPKLRDYK